MKTFTTKCSVLALLLLLLSQGVYAQREGYNWYFGNGAGMTWNSTQNTAAVGGKMLTGMPTPLAGSAMGSQLEGVFCLSTPSGELMFYSNGMTIWNKNHQVMTNGTGLTGHNSSTQSGIILPYPGNPNLFITVTVGANEDGTNSQLCYSVIDMTQNGGLGSVITKNIQLTGYTGVMNEQIAAVRHSNGNDFWLVSISKGNGTESALHVWKVTSDGVNATRHSTYPLGFNTVLENIGYLRFSGDGTRFAWPPMISNNLVFGSFDPASGEFIDVKFLNNGPLGMITYGAEFSSSGEILYISNTNTSPSIYAFKFAELLSASNISSVSHKAITGINANFTASALQLAPDGRIYGVRQNASTLLVLENVDDYDNVAIYNVANLIPPGTTGAGGLPNFMTHLMINPKAGIIGSDTTICANTAPAILTSIANGTDIVSYQWQRSTDNSTWADIAGATSATFSPPSLAVTTYYRREARNYAGSEASNVVTITIASALSAGSISGSSQPIPSGSTPAAITSTTPATGGAGTITYQWQSSTNNSTWADIAGANGTGYSPGALTTTTHFRRRVSCDCGNATSNTVTITVESIGGDIITANGTSICSGESTTLSATASSVVGPTFRWYNAETGGTLLHTGGTFTPSPNLVTTTTFYVSVEGTSQSESSRKAVTVTVMPLTTPNMIKIQ